MTDNTRGEFPNRQNLQWEYWYDRTVITTPARNLKHKLIGYSVLTYGVLLLPLLLLASLIGNNEPLPAWNSPLCLCLLLGGLGLAASTVTILLALTSSGRRFENGTYVVPQSPTASFLAIRQTIHGLLDRFHSTDPTQTIDPVEVWSIPADFSPIPRVGRRGSANVILVPKGMEFIFDDFRPQCIALLAHEVGHVIQGDVEIWSVASAVGTAILWATPALVVFVLAALPGAQNATVFWKMVGSVFGPLGAFVTIREAIQKAESRADLGALAYTDGCSVSDALRQFCRSSRFPFSTHPSVQQRVQDLDRAERQWRPEKLRSAGRL